MRFAPYFIWNMKYKHPLLLLSFQTDYNIDISEYLAPAGTQSVWVMNVEIIRSAHNLGLDGMLSCLMFFFVPILLSSMFLFSRAPVRPNRNQQRNMLPVRKMWVKTKTPRTINVLVNQCDLWWCCLSVCVSACVLVCKVMWFECTCGSIVEGDHPRKIDN